MEKESNRFKVATEAGDIFMAIEIQEFISGIPGARRLMLLDGRSLTPADNDAKSFKIVGSDIIVWKV